ncbi:hypothetical protein MIND_00997900 [Mycena indigotica]|uniref:Uncharacterized protein n=1 Tax=Mycena indigotica TaxID=2126181 RepID=A0A8H6S848_9AGAR|nr:uncharacterized protein MIND_00997900 [Mycena indigotica]KAF7294613.1 hypothetical protein MIND_00997900 [Mycena indigotica]
MPPPPPDADSSSGFQYEPLRASVIDVFEQLGAFDEDSGLVEWMFPEIHEEKQLRARTRVKLTEVFDEPQEQPETPRKSRLASRFFGIRTRARSKSQARSKKEKETITPSTPKQKTRSSPNLRKAADLPSTDGPELESPPLNSAATTPEHTKSRRMSIFPRRPPPPPLIEGPRPSLSDEEWQQITMTGSIADYNVTNPFIGHQDPRAPATSSSSSSRKSNDTTSTPKRNGPFSRFTHTFSRSTPTSPTREASSSQPPLPTSDPATPTRSSPQVDPSRKSDSEIASRHSNASTDTLQAVPAGDGDGDSLPQVRIHADDERLETTSQIDHQEPENEDAEEEEQYLGSGSESEDDYGVLLNKDSDQVVDSALAPAPQEEEAPERHT